MKVLIADDSEFMRMILKDILHGIWADAEIFEAANGDEAVTQFQGHPDIVLLDIMMPGKTGLEVLKEIGADTPVLVISAAGQQNMIDEARQLGARDFIVKPFEKEKVVQTIKTALGGDRLSQENHE